MIGAAADGVHRGEEGLLDREKRILLPAPNLRLFLTTRWTPPRSLRASRGSRLRPVGVGVDQRVLGRKVLVDPVGGLVRGLELADVGEQLLPQRRRLVWVQNGPGRTDDLLLSTGSRRRGRPFLNRCRPAAIARLRRALWRRPPVLAASALRAFGKVRRVEIVFACDADQGEEGVASARR